MISIYQKICYNFCGKYYFSQKYLHNGGYLFMDTKIIYEVNEDYAGIGKDWSARIIGVFDNLTLVKFVDGQGLYALFEGALYNEDLKKVTLKFTKNVYVFDSFVDAVNKFAAEVSRRRFNSAF